MPFTRMDTTAKKPERVVVVAWGLPKEGKTTFALSFPEPLYLLNMDMGAEEIAPQFPGKEIYESKIAVPEQFTTEGYRPVVDGLMEDYKLACVEASKRGGSIVVDTSTQMWQAISHYKVETAREARREAAKKKGRDPDDVKDLQTDYGDANLMMGGLIRLVYQFPTLNAVFIDRAKEKYNERGQATGVMVRQGWSELEATAQVVIHISAKTTPDGKFGGVFGKIERSRFAVLQAYMGMDIKNPSYEALAGLLDPDA